MRAAAFARILGAACLTVLLVVALLPIGYLAVRRAHHWYECATASRGPGDLATQYHPITDTCTAHVFGSDIRISR